MSNTELKSAVNTYSELDLSRESGLVQDLLARADAEATSQITLSSEGDEGAMATGLTPGMRGWLQAYVMPKRTAAIAEAQAAAGKVSVGNAPGILDRVEIDAKKRHRASRRAEISGNFRANHGGLLNDYEEARSEYQQMRFEEGGRDAKVPNRFFEWLVLLPLIMVPEGMLNYESFRQAPIIQSGFQALGVTILVGVGIAFAAHYIGLFIRQFNFFMRADDGHQNRLGWPMWTIGLFLLFVSLGVVGYARYYYLLPQIGLALMRGEAPPNVVLQTSSLLLGNLVVFLIGAAITFMLHDRNPDFSDKHRKLQQLRRKLDAVRKNEVGNQLAALDRAFKEDTEKLKKQAALMEKQPNYAGVKAATSAIDGKDGEVLGALSLYKDRLAERLRTTNPDFTFRQYYGGGNDLVEARQLSIADFQALPTQLLWCA